MIHTPAVGTVAERARMAGPCTTFVDLLSRCGFDGTVGAGVEVTAFAPDDAAFDALPPHLLDGLARLDQLHAVLAYHLVPGRVCTDAAVAARRLLTLQGEDLFITGHDGVHVDGTRVIAGDLEAENGLVHVVDRVLLPARICGAPA